MQEAEKYIPISHFPGHLGALSWQMWTPSVSPRHGGDCSHLLARTTYSSLHLSHNPAQGRPAPVSFSLCSDLLLILCKSEALILPDMGSLVLQLDTYTPYFVYPNMLTACSSWTSSCWTSPQHSSSANTCGRSGKKATQTKAFCEKIISRMWDFCTAFA